METEQFRAGGSDWRARDQARVTQSYPSEDLAMRNVIVSTLTQVVEIGIFAAAAGALAVGMMHVR